MKVEQCDAILQYGIFEDVQVQTSERYRSVLSKVFSNTKIKDRGTTINWASSLKALLPTEFSPTPIPMNYDGTFGANHKNYYSEALADDLYSETEIEKHFKGNYKKASEPIINGWLKCIEFARTDRGLSPEVAHNTTQPYSVLKQTLTAAQLKKLGVTEGGLDAGLIEVAITKFAVKGDTGSKVYLKKATLVKSLEALGLMLDARDFTDVLLGYDTAEHFSILVPPSLRGTIINIPIKTTDQRYKTWLTVLSPLPENNALHFGKSTLLADNNAQHNLFLRIANDTDTVKAYRLKADFQMGAADMGVGVARNARAFIKVLDRATNTPVAGPNEVIRVTDQDYSDPLIFDLYIEPKKKMELLAQITDYGQPGYTPMYLPSFIMKVHYQVADANWQKVTLAS